MNFLAASAAAPTNRERTAAFAGSWDGAATHATGSTSAVTATGVLAPAPTLVAVSGVVESVRPHGAGEVTRGAERLSSGASTAVPRKKNAGRSTGAGPTTPGAPTTAA